MIIMVYYMCRDSVGRGDEEGRIDVGGRRERGNVGSAGEMERDQAVRYV